MLKLEKISRRGDINLTFRHRERLLNKLLLQAFGIAFVWHAAAFFLFHVGGFKIMEESIHAPIAVDADIAFGSLDDNILAQATIDEEQRLYRFALPPHFSEPQIPELNAVIPPLSFPFVYFDDWTRNPFEAIEKDMQDNYFARMEKPEEHPKMQVFVSGAISHRLIPLSGIEELIPPPGESQRWNYTVKILDEEGEIFWHQPQDVLSRDNENLAKKLFQALRFVPDQKGFVSTGDIEIVFHEAAHD